MDKKTEWHMSEGIYEEILVQEKIKVVSFDIFDTLLFRKVKEPKDVFLLMYNKIKDLIPASINELEWKEIRVNAEKDARKRKKKLYDTYEVTFDEIYEAMPIFINNIDKIKQYELKTEEEVCYINSYIYNVMQNIKRERRLKIILISDMYLRQDSLKNILLLKKFPLDILDGFYVSNEYGKNKVVGDLYDFVIKDIEIGAAEMVHIGDNIKSDYESPRKRGIWAIHYLPLKEEN